MGRPKGSRNEKGQMVTKFTQVKADFVVAKIEEGLTITQACRDFPNILPDRLAIDRWQKAHPEFKKAIFEAYQIFFIKKLEELEDLSKELLTNEVDQQTGEFESAKDDLFRLRARKEAIQVRINTLQYLIRNVAPKFVPELKETQSQQQLVLPQITVINYSDESMKPKIIDGEVDTKRIEG